LEITLVLTLVTSLIQIIGFVIYDVQAFRKMLNPNLATWGIFAGITILNFTSYHSMSGDWMVSLLPTVSAMFNILTFVVAIAKGGRFRDIDKFDRTAFVIGIVAGITWILFKSAANSNLIVQFAVIVAFVPIYKALWKKPSLERPLPWLIWSGAYTLGVILVYLRNTDHWEAFVYPGVCVALHLGVALLTKRSPRVVETAAKKV